jgi:hypothetical protein
MKDEELREMILPHICTHVTGTTLKDAQKAAAAVVKCIRRHDGHAEFVRSVQSKALHGVEALDHDGRQRNWFSYYRLVDILSLCDAELAKEN